MQAAVQVVEVLSDALTLPETPPAVKIARLMVVSDLLHNTGTLTAQQRRGIASEGVCVCARACVRARALALPETPPAVEIVRPLGRLKPAAHSSGGSSPMPELSRAVRTPSLRGFDYSMHPKPAALDACACCTLAAGASVCNASRCGALL